MVGEHRGTPQQRHAQREGDILAILDGGPSDTNTIARTLREIAVADAPYQMYVGWDHGAIRGHLRALERRGFVTRESQGWAKPLIWTITDEGRREFWN